MKKSLILSLILSANLNWAATPTADVAIVLDTSGSMQGLINQVRDGLWKTLNSLGELKKDGEKARVRLALFEYGSGIVSGEAGHIQLLSELSTDHTAVAEALFATTTTGSNEFSGLAIQRATDHLSWSDSLEDFKSIVIAGNETIHQGPQAPIDAAKIAFGKDIIVNTIFAGAQTQAAPRPFGGGHFGCGGFFCPNPTPVPNEPPVQTEPVANPIFLEWTEMANAGGGKILNIDHNQSAPYIPSPFDEEIIKKTTSINETFLPFGKKGQSQYDRMVDLDGNIRNSGAGSYMDWGDYRGGSFGVGSQSDWDLVSLFIESEESSSEKFMVTLSKLSDEELPELLKNKTLSEKVSLVKDFVQKRTDIENDIAELKEKRKLFVENEREQREGETKTFDAAFKEIITQQLEDKGFSL